MRAVVWHGKQDVRVDRVDDPSIEEPTDAVVRVTHTAICGSDLHLYKGIAPGMMSGDIVGHEPLGIVEEVGPDVIGLAPGDRVAVPFNVSCGWCPSCSTGFQSQCETTQNHGPRKGASLLGYTHLYGGVPGGQAEYLRVPFAGYGPIRIGEEVPAERAVLLADVLPTAWQAVTYADVPRGGTVGIWGLGPIGQVAARVARHLGAGRVIGIDPVPARREMAERHGVETVDPSAVDDVTEVVGEMTSGYGVDSAIDAVGMEAEGSTVDHALQTIKLQTDRLDALRVAVGSLRRGGTLSISGVYLGWYPLFPLGDLFDKQIAIRMGQANVRRWTDDILPLVEAPADPLGLDDLVTHVRPLAEAPDAYAAFQEKADHVVKVVLTP